MLREVDEYMDMIINSDHFWKSYLNDDPKIEKQTVDDPLFVIKDVTTEEEMCLETQPLQAEIVFVQSSAVEGMLGDMKLENPTSDIKIETVDLFNAVEEDVNEDSFELLDVDYGNEEEVDRPCPRRRKRNIIRNTCDICDKST